jgi:mono/diheme cytochrome c family protein
MTRTQIEISLGLVMVLLAATFLVLVGFNEENRMAEREAEVQAEAIEVGAELFESNCSPCHGNQGLGIAGLAPALNDASLFTTRLKEVGWAGTLEDYIISTISVGRSVSTRPELYVGAGVPAMASWAQNFGGPLRDDQIRDIAQYILNFEQTAIDGVVVEVLPTPTPATDDPVARGEAVYLAAGCGACHAITGVAEGVVGPAQTNIGEVAATRVDGLSAEEYIRQSILQPSAFIVDGYNEGIMPQNYGDTISPSDLEDLVTFLLAQK